MRNSFKFFLLVQMFLGFSSQAHEARQPTIERKNKASILQTIINYIQYQNPESPESVTGKEEFVTKESETTGTIPTDAVNSDTINGAKALNYKGLKIPKDPKDLKEDRQGSKATEHRD